MDACLTPPHYHLTMIGRMNEKTLEWKCLDCGERHKTTVPAETQEAALVTVKCPKTGKESKVIAANLRS